MSFSTLGQASRFISEPEKVKRRANRRKIQKFSKRSAKRLRHVVRNTEEKWDTFITLTYPNDFPTNGRETKTHLNAFLQYLRRKKIVYVWVLEFQERGAPHYHIIASGRLPYRELAERWFAIVDSGDPRHLEAGTRIETIRSKKHLYGYLSGYIKKLDQKEPPVGFENVGRFWGATRGILVFEAFQKLGHFYKLSRHTKLIRKWYKAYLRQFGIKWKWKGQGFTALDGASLVNVLSFNKK